MSSEHKDTLVKAQTATVSTTRRLMIPYLGVEWYRRIIHSDGRIEFIPQLVMDANAEGAGDEK